MALILNFYWYSDITQSRGDRYSIFQLYFNEEHVLTSQITFYILAEHQTCKYYFTFYGFNVMIQVIVALDFFSSCSLKVPASNFSWLTKIINLLFTTSRRICSTFNPKHHHSILQASKKHLLSFLFTIDSTHDLCPYIIYKILTHSSIETVGRYMLIFKEYNKFTYKSIFTKLHN